MITSTRNPKVKYVRALQAQGKFRRGENAFVVEGVRLVDEAIKADWDANLVFFEEGLSQRGEALVATFADRGAQVLQVSQQVMRAASDTQTPQGLMAVLPIKELPVPEIFDFLFIPDAVRDPGNMGTMLRTALAAGVDAVFIPPETVDVYAPKVIRAGMGAHFHLPILNLDWKEIEHRIRNLKLKVYLADASKGKNYSQADFQHPCALIIGSEAEGAGGVARHMADDQLHIPMPGDAESLNAAVAAGVLLFEVVRQRSTS